MKKKSLNHVHLQLKKKENQKNMLKCSAQNDKSKHLCCCCY